MFIAEANKSVEPIAARWAAPAYLVVCATSSSGGSVFDYHNHLFTLHPYDDMHQCKTPF
jgi:hypothetical protein